MKQKFTIFFTGDIHGRDKQSARLFSLYKEKRKEAEEMGNICFFFDSGDSADRSVEYCGLTKCRAYSHILNAMAYDAQTVGNDIGLVYGPGALQAQLKELNFPVLGANFRDGEKAPLEGLKERIILERDNIKVGVFGMTNPWGRAYESHGFHFPANKECAEDQCRKLREEEADLILFLSHMGLIEEMEILMEVPGIDIVIGGHSHTRTPGGLFNNNGTLFHHSGEYAQYLGRVDFIYDRDSGKIIEKAAETYHVRDDVPEAPEILKAIKRAEVDASEIGKIELGYCDTELNLDYWNECRLGNLAADALKRYYDADLAIIAGGNLNNGISRGTINMSDLNRACFTTSNPCFSYLSGQEILKGLERGLDEDLSGYYHHGLRGAPVGIPQLSGLSVRADLSAKKGNRIKEMKIGTAYLDKNRTYKVAHTDLENHGKLGYFPFAEPQANSLKADRFLRDILIDFIKKEQNISVESPVRWNFILRDQT